MSPLPTNQHLPRRSRKLQHRVSHSGQICPLRHTCSTCPRGPKDQNQGVGFPEMPPSPCWQHLLSAHLAQQTGTPDMPHSPGNTCHVVQETGTPEMPHSPSNTCHVVQETGTQRCLIHLATPAMLSRRQAPRDAPFTWEHLPRGPGDRHPEMPRSPGNTYHVVQESKPV